jgi:hypothetical protein
MTPLHSKNATITRVKTPPLHSKNTEVIIKTLRLSGQFAGRNKYTKTQRCSLKKKRVLSCSQREISQQYVEVFHNQRVG